MYQINSFFEKAKTIHNKQHLLCHPATKGTMTHRAKCSKSWPITRIFFHASSAMTLTASPVRSISICLPTS